MCKNGTKIESLPRVIVLLKSQITRIDKKLWETSNGNYYFEHEMYLNYHSVRCLILGSTWNRRIVDCLAHFISELNCYFVMRMTYRSIINTKRFWEIWWENVFQKNENNRIVFWQLNFCYHCSNVVRKSSKNVGKRSYVLRLNTLRIVRFTALRLSLIY